MVMFFIAIQAWAASAVFIPAHNLQLLKSSGKSTEGVITNLRTRTVHGKHTHTDYYVDYTYHLTLHYFDGNKNTVFQRTALVPFMDFQTTRVGQKVQVFYDQDMPGKAALAFETSYGVSVNDPANWPGFYSYLMNGVLILVFLLMFRWQLLQYLKERNLLIMGYAAQALVVDKKERSTRGGKVVTLTYQFKDGSGQTVQAVGKNIPAVQIDGNEQALTVLYDPVDSSNSAIYPLRFVSCIEAS